MRALLMPAAVAAVQITSPSHHDASAMRETFYNLAAAKSKNGGKIDPETKEIVEKILEEIDSKLVDGLWADRNSAQQLLDVAHTAIATCNDDIDIDRYNYEKETTIVYWQNWINCVNGENTCCAEKVARCDELDEKTCALKICDDTILKETNECVDCKETKPTESDLYKTLECLYKFDEEYYDEWTGCWHRCKDKESELADKVKECDMTQEHLEIQKCNEQKVIHEICQVFDSCRAGAVDTYETQLATVNDLEATFQKQYEALLCLKCYGDEILADKTDLSNCENSPPPCFSRNCNAYSDDDRSRTFFASPTDCPAENEPAVDLVICKPEIPEPTCCDCLKDPCVPGTESYWTKMYGNYSTSCAAVGECFHTCHDKYA